MDRLLERAARPHDDPRGTGVCLYAETLAAWTDGSLSAADRAAAEAHAADCNRCLAVLAAIATTTPPSEAARPSWFSVRWLVPVATATLAIAVWVLVQAPPEPEPESKSAATQSIDSVAPAPPVAAPERDASSAAARPKTEAPPRTAPTAKRAEPRAADEARPQTSAPAPAATPPAPPPPSAAPQLMARFSAVATVTSPDRKVVWRIDGTAIERSTDAGITWTRQSLEPPAELLAGSSPDPRVCWLAGRRGAVFLSTDGETWQRLPFPDLTADLVNIEARSAQSATVTTAAGRTYRTDDGGGTWVVQENPAAPF